jgi:hypothetical protein
MNSVIDKYLESNSKESAIDLPENPSLEACIVRAELRDEGDNPVTEIPIGRRWKIMVRYKVNTSIKGLVSSIGIVSGHDIALKTSWQQPITVEPGEYEAFFEEHLVNFSVGQYKICIGLSQNRRTIQYLDNILVFDIIPVIDELDESTLVYDNSTGVILNAMNTVTRQIT